MTVKFFEGSLQKFLEYDIVCDIIRGLEVIGHG
jgi:hypothetical protein